MFYSLKGALNFCFNLKQLFLNTKTRIYSLSRQRDYWRLHSWQVKWLFLMYIISLSVVSVNNTRLQQDHAFLNRYKIQTILNNRSERLWLESKYMHHLFSSSFISALYLISLCAVKQIMLKEICVYQLTP